MGKPYRAIRPMFQRDRWRIFPGDMVWVNTGQCKGETGKVLQVIKDKRAPQVIVEGVNLRKRKIFTGSADSEYFVITVEAPLHYSQVNLLEPLTAASADAAAQQPQSSTSAPSTT